MATVDTDLIVKELLARGHVVKQVISVPSNAGDYEFITEDGTLTLDEVRALLESDSTD